ncbi:MAG: zinc ABC transporter substrate-binding protein [Lachnospiraceae bacterium]|nr:zinc ABC transporter substrate-binding protein [Lachnospiraceae bacterium]
MLKRKLLILLAIMLVFSGISLGLIRAYGRRSMELPEEELVLVTSFYPVHLLAQNLLEGAEGVSLINLTENHTGCLHDYQLTTQDMLTLEYADALIINGGDMELFVTAAVEGQPELVLIDTSEGITFLEGTEHTHEHAEESSEEHEHEEVHEEEHEHMEGETHEHEEEHDHDDHDEESAEHNHAINGHVWLNTELYMQQLDTLTEKLCALDVERAELYRANAARYRAELAGVATEYQTTLAGLAGSEVVVFHDAFYYLCEELGIEVIMGISMDADTALSAAELAEAEDEIRLHGVRYLLAEEATGAVAEQLAKEIGIQVIYLNPLTSGAATTEAYLDAMRQNMAALQEMLQ